MGAKYTSRKNREHDDSGLPIISKIGAREARCARPYKGEIRAGYTNFVSYLVNALPQGWARAIQPPLEGVIDGVRYFSPDGTDWTIWVSFDATEKDYCLGFRIVKKKAPNPRAATPAPTSKSAGGDIRA